MGRCVFAAVLLCSIVAAGGPVAAEASTSAPLTTTYGCTGSPQTTTVPAGVATLTVTAAGAQGGTEQLTGSDAGLGGTVTATVPIGGAVKAGDTLKVYVGCTPSGTAGGFGFGPGGNGGVGGGGGSGVFDPSAGTSPLILAV